MPTHSSQTMDIEFSFMPMPCHFNYQPPHTQFMPNSCWLNISAHTNKSHKHIHTVHVQDKAYQAKHIINNPKTWKE